MARIVVILASFLACSGLIVWLVATTVGVGAMRRGSEAYGYRPGLKQLLAARPPARRLVAWVGDSTILGRRRPSFPQLLRPSLRKLGADGIVLAGPGFDPFVHYFLMGRILEQDPEVVVLVARLSAFHSKGEDRRFSYNDLSSFIPARGLPRSFLLPLSDRQLSPARLVLAQALDFDAPERLFYFAEGVRLLYHDAAFWSPLGPAAPPPVFAGRTADALRVFDVSISRRQPTVRMLEATVRMVTDAGRTAIVVGVPVPDEALRKTDWYDPAVSQARFDVLRAAVEDAGGQFVDLHEALPAAQLADYAGHFTTEGAQQLADAIWPRVSAALGAPAGGRSD
jgi:hypothetical protein